MIDVVGSLSVVTLIFGGCCSNVYALEEILKLEADSGMVQPPATSSMTIPNPRAGLLITFLQFLLATITSVSTQLSTPSPVRASSKPKVPLLRWAFIASMFYAVNMLNNWAFAFSISVPVHIILRSFGSVWTMAAGYLRGKRYTRLQTLSVAMLTLGVITSAWADAESKGRDLSSPSSSSSLSSSSSSSMRNFLAGLTLLLTAQILSAYMGVYVQDTYADHATTWQENLFWSHFLSLPLFLPLAPTLKRQYLALDRTAPLGDAFPTPADEAHGKGTYAALARAVTSYRIRDLPSGVFFLALNAATQLACISGVNVLSSRSSAVTVTIVLNVRKLVSFMLSTWLFGHSVGAKMASGAALVFGSGALYGWETSWRIPRGKQGQLSADGHGVGRGKGGKSQ